MIAAEHAPSARVTLPSSIPQRRREGSPVPYETTIVTDTFAVIVEDSPATMEVLAHSLVAIVPRVLRAETLAAARQAVAQRAGALLAVLLDLRLPDGNGMALVHELRAAGSDAAIVVITAQGSMATSIEAMRAGADDFLIKPFTPDRLMTTMRNALERRRLSRLVRDMAPNAEEGGFEGFVGNDLSMQALYRTIDLAARSNATVFITGESGTGKELCAEAAHRRSARRRGPFVALNCAAIPRELIESEVFGHVRGAFTGAVAERDGAALRADGGSLLLDEICEMEAAMQSKLLRFLQTGVARKVGSDRNVKVDVRIICATNRDPLAEVEAGRFREDLYYRLHVVPLHIPPLRERGDDVMLIASHFLAKYGKEEGRRFVGFSAEAEAVLRACRWPGNVRQLQNAVRNAVVLHDGERVTAEMLPDLGAHRPGAAGHGPVFFRGTADNGVGMSRMAGEPRDAIRPLELVERDAIEGAIAACDGNMTEAAQRLGISVKTVYRKRQAWGLAAA
jgi:two-component system repressor protein LuxO